MADWRVGGGYSGEKKKLFYSSLFFGAAAAAGRDFDLQCTWNYDCGRRGKVYAFEIKAATLLRTILQVGWWDFSLHPSVLLWQAVVVQCNSPSLCVCCLGEREVGRGGKRVRRERVRNWETCNSKRGWGEEGEATAASEAPKFEASFPTYLVVGMANFASVLRAAEMPWTGSTTCFRKCFFPLASSKFYVSPLSCFAQLSCPISTTVQFPLQKYHVSSDKG